MKKHFYIVLILFLGCTKYEVPLTYSIIVKVVYPENIKNGNSISDIEVLLKNTQTGREFYKNTDEKGEASFQIRGGVYDIIISFSEEHEVNDSNSLKKLQFSASILGQQILENQIYLTLQTNYSILTEDFVIKELYTSGSRTPEGKLYYRDSFIEIYNNSERTLFSDGLCIGVVHETTSARPTTWVDSNGNLLDKIPCWSFIAIIPGSGEENPVEPGSSILIANSGINHKNDPNANPNSIDLSVADWEFYVDYHKNIDAPAVPNLIMQRITRLNHFMVFDVRGQSCILFRLPNDSLQNIFTNQNNFMIQPGGKELAFMVPKEWVIDGIDNLQSGESVIYKRLLNSIDIGYVQHKGTGERVSIRRKVKEVINGRTVYQDTNNSTNDFLTNQEPTPGVIATN